MFIDTHAHLFMKDFADDLVDVIHRAQDAGVEYVVCPGTDLETSRASILLAEQYDCVYAAVGFHPHDAKKGVNENGVMEAESIREIMRMAQHPKVVAIGEIGLDYHYNFSPPHIQRVVFSTQIRIARERNLPIIIHTRESESDVLRVVEHHLREDGEWRSSSPKGVFHCFSGDGVMAEKVIGWGFFISIPGPVTFPAKGGKPNTMAEVVRQVPMEQILLETDSPYLTPHPYRGKRNEPANIPFIAEKIAAVKGLALEDIARASTASTHKLFAPLG